MTLAQECIQWQALGISSADPSSHTIRV